MWIRMKETYAGQAGLFCAGLLYDLPAKTLQALPKESYCKTSDPWDMPKKPKKGQPHDSPTETGQQETASPAEPGKTENVNDTTGQTAPPGQKAGQLSGQIT